MAVTISNLAARQIKTSKTAVSDWGTWSSSLTTANAGYYSSSTGYVIQLRFQLDKPCSAITFYATSEDSSAKIDWKVSTVEQDTTLALASMKSGVTADFSTAPQYGETPEEYTVTGTFKANTTYYLYGFKYGTSYNAVKYYIFYSSKYYTKVTGATELQGVVRIGDGSDYNTYFAYIGNGTSFDLYLAYIGDGTTWNLYTG